LIGTPIAVILIGDLKRVKMNTREFKKYPNETKKTTKEACENSAWEQSVSKPAA
jgi:hypothetical protein